ncbi:MAG: hypothetical protein Fur0023_21680 [Bacteroidia bacterium]
MHTSRYDVIRMINLIIRNVFIFGSFSTPGSSMISDSFINLSLLNLRYNKAIPINKSINDVTIWNQKNGTGYGKFSNPK